MRYRFTVWNVIIAIVVPYVIVIMLRSSDANQYLGAAYSIPFLLAGLIIDLVLQYAIKNRKTLAIVEIVSLAAILIINQLP